MSDSPPTPTSNLPAFSTGDGKPIFVYDCEVFSNLFLCILCDGVQWLQFDHSTIPALLRFVSDKAKVLAGFNSHAYDDKLLQYLVRHPSSTPADLFALSQRIIEPDADARDPVPWFEKPWAYSIDVLQLLNGRGSLKEWECRSGFPVVVESAADFMLPCPPELVEAVTTYCHNDVAATVQLLRQYWPLVEMRTALARRFNLQEIIYTYSEPKLAQTTFLTLHQRRSGQPAREVRAAALANPDNTRTVFPFSELMSQKLAFTTPPFQELHRCLQRGSLRGSGDGRAWAMDVPDLDLSRPLPLAGTRYALGIGGLHSVDHAGIEAATTESLIFDLDATSYYPSIIIAEGIYPRQLGPEFVQDMTQLRNQRLEAKRSGDKMTADALKIVLNSTYGKLNDQWSPLRSVVDAHRVTLNGQLFLLMLIEQLGALGCEILSANTDGVTVRCPMALAGEPLQGTIAHWQSQTGLVLESSQFSRICRRDVNSYIARTTDGKIKTKGAFNPESGKGDGSVIKDAAVGYLLDGVDPAHSIATEQDPTAFLFYQRVKNGGKVHWGEREVGSIVRWYASVNGESIRRKNPNGSWAILPHGQTSVLAMDITSWKRLDLRSLDVAHYISEAWKLIREIEPEKSLYQQLSFL